MDENRQQTMTSASLPAHARLPINHCNLPPLILGSLTFQHHPTPLHLDGVEQLHAALFESLDPVVDADTRAEHFMDYMRSSFLLDNLDEAGFDEQKCGIKRGKADYLRILRGWLFDADGKEAAVLKSWVESRFGLLPLNHRGPLGVGAEDNYHAYLSARAKGLYNTNALESQLDLLYSYGQYEVTRQYPGEHHVTLYRGVNRIDEHEILHQPAKDVYILTLNNINSFSSNRERADEFGDYILEVKVPLTKLLYFPRLLPNALKGEEEHLVIGGVYEVKMSLL